MTVDHLVGVYRLENGFIATLFRCVISDGTPTRPETGEIAQGRVVRAGDIPHPRSNLLHHSLDDIVAGRRGVVRVGLPRIS